MARRVLGEFLGTMLLVAAVVGSGIMAANLTSDVGLQLLMNMVATVLALGLLIWTLGPISGGHFNPAGSAYLFTSSTSFANPAVTIGRMSTDTFSGITPASAPAFLAAQAAGTMIGAAVTEVFHPRPGRVPEPLDLPAPLHIPPQEAP